MHSPSTIVNLLLLINVVFLGSQIQNVAVIANINKTVCKNKKENRTTRLRKKTEMFEFERNGGARDLLRRKGTALTCLRLRGGQAVVGALRPVGRDRESRRTAGTHPWPDFLVSFEHPFILITDLGPKVCLNTTHSLS